ncbi:MAG: roadblock/LC7 domain-containing protein [Candidatus Thermoplasmatota archaeon]
MTSVGDIKEELKRLSANHRIDVSAIVSRSGVPIAWNVPDEGMVETFATLSATIVGAAEVVYTSMGRTPPRRIIIDAEGGVFVAAPIGSKALLVGLSSQKDRTALASGIDRAVEAVRGVLSSD